MKKYKRIIPLVTFFVGVVMLVLISLHHQFAVLYPQQIKVGATYMTLNNDFYNILNAEIEKNLGARGGLIYVRDSELDEGKQSQQIDYFIQKKVDVIVISPVKSGSSRVAAAIRRAKKKGIKIVAVDSQVSLKEDVDVTIVSDNYYAGVLLAEDMMTRVDRADILLLEHRETQSARDRIKGFRETIRNEEAYRIVSQRETLGQTEDSMPQVEQVIEEGTHFDVVVSLNDQTAIGALAAIKARGDLGKVYIYGIDGSPDVKRFLASTDDITATVYQSPIKMGDKVTEVIDLMAQNEPYQAEYIIPVGLLTRENIHRYHVTGWQ